MGKYKDDSPWPHGQDLRKVKTLADLECLGLPELPSLWETLFYPEKIEGKRRGYYKFYLKLSSILGKNFKDQAFTVLEGDFKFSILMSSDEETFQLAEVYRRHCVVADDGDIVRYFPLFKNLATVARAVKLTESIKATMFYLGFKKLPH
ncbi:MAG: hypothetical protein AAB503_00455 [Patescibacteria group bacterium]